MAEIQQVDKVAYVDKPDPVDRGSNMLARLVSLIGFIIFALLAFRFVLSLLGANRNNPFADFIYDVSYPLVAPFFGLFNYTPQFGTARFEFETLVAMLFYAVVIGIIVRLVSIGKRQPV